MRRILTSGVVILAIASAGPGPVRAAAETDLSGIYMSTGDNPDGTQYEGVVHIEALGDSVMITWLFASLTADGHIALERRSVGVGIVSGATLSASYYMGNATGVIVYQIQSDGERLAGRWTIAGDGGRLFNETLTRLPDDAVPVRPAHTAGRGVMTRARIAPPRSGH